MDPCDAIAPNEAKREGLHGISSVTFSDAKPSVREGKQP